MTVASSGEANRASGSRFDSPPASNEAQASPWVERWLRLLPAGARVLDFAAGSGRNTRAAALRGLRVVAVDRDERVSSLSSAAGDAHGEPAVVARVADLESGPWPFGEERFDAVIVANYLFRPRFHLLASLVAPDGLLVYETFARGHERHGRPSNPAFLLEPGELFERCRRAGLTVLAFEAGTVERASIAVVQRVCAVRARGAGAERPLG